jgi:hypothetical protein
LAGQYGSSSNGFTPCRASSFRGKLCAAWGEHHDDYCP